jgi:hypothetical protein
MGGIGNCKGNGAKPAQMGQNDIGNLRLLYLSIGGQRAKSYQGALTAFSRTDSHHQQLVRK